MQERDLRALYAYLNSDERTQALVRDMVVIIHDTDASEEDSEASRLTILEALFPSKVEAALEG